MIAFVLYAVACPLVLLALAACLYQVAAAVAAHILPNTASPTSGEPYTDFAIVIPAHNESGVLQSALQSCARIDYPDELYAVYVIADNCDDDTARIAAAGGARLLVRRTDREFGKGFALQWALPQVLERDHAAVVVLDADCQLNRQSLRVFDGELRQGRQVIQAAYRVANPDDTGMTYLQGLALFVEDRFFYLAKSSLGLAVLLQGTGMVFDRAVLTAHPWHATSLTEDTEYSCRLLRAGVPITFTCRATVTTSCPVAVAALSVQRARWVFGAVQVVKREAWPLLRDGVRLRRLQVFDAGWTLLLLSRPLLCAELILAAAAAALCRFVAPGPLSTLLIGGVVAAAGLYLAYGLAAVIAFGLTWRRCRLLLELPWNIMRYSAIALRGVIQRPVTWRRTPRAEDEWATARRLSGNRP